ARCTACGKCADVCRYHALTVVNRQVLFFRNLCHVCGACQVVCPEKAIREEPRKIGTVRRGISGEIQFSDGMLETGEGSMTPRLIKKVKEINGEGLTLIDAPPGTSCPVVETVKNADLVVLVTDPTPFGLHDLTLAVDMCREVGTEPVVVVNRAEYDSRDLLEYCGREKLAIVAEIPDQRKIAECYSVGDLVVDRFPEFGELFRELALKLVGIAAQSRFIPPSESGTRQGDVPHAVKEDPVFSTAVNTVPADGVRKEVVVISGKGGTGKTSLTAAFTALEKSIAVADGDVDAADLHLVLRPRVMTQGTFSGGEKASIDRTRCTRCGICLRACRFDAVRRVTEAGGNIFTVDEKACQGCGVCSLVCPEGAVVLSPAVNGDWYESETRFGPFTHARLGIAEENSGKLVSLIREKSRRRAEEAGLSRALIDGAPGTGCPVIASLTGADYAVVVTEPTVSGVHDLTRILEVIRFFGIRAGVIVNKHDLNREKTMEIRKLAGTVGADFLGTVTYDKAVTRAQVNGLSVVEYANGRCLEEVTRIWEGIRTLLAKDGRR
ncbi:MAG TPA: 4Fe-4S dicluster domain-containing protein, partial [Spirochaetia bacterium]|nr:4Fe-4S dicluster domain-containing protein [Spirochaetia bacterium]